MQHDVAVGPLCGASLSNPRVEHRSAAFARPIPYELHNASSSRRSLAVGQFGSSPVDGEVPVEGFAHGNGVLGRLDELDRLQRRQVLTLAAGAVAMSAPGV